MCATGVLERLPKFAQVDRDSFNLEKTVVEEEVTRIVGLQKQASDNFHR